MKYFTIFAWNRLSPIGESGRNSPRDVTQIFIRQPSSSTKRSSYDSDRIMNTIDKRRSWLVASPIGGNSSKDGSSNVPSVVTGRNRFDFIVIIERFSFPPWELEIIYLWQELNVLCISHENRTFSIFLGRIERFRFNAKKERIWVIV